MQWQESAGGGLQVQDIASKLELLISTGKFSNQVSGGRSTAAMRAKDGCKSQTDSWPTNSTGALDSHSFRQLRT